LLLVLAPVLRAAVLGASVFGIAVSGAQAADYPLEIIDLKSALPEDLIPILAPLAGPDGSVVGARGALFVRAAPQRVSDIRQALTRLDRPARTLVIQVRQALEAQGAGSAVGAVIDESVTWGGADTRVRVGVPPERHPGARHPDGSSVMAAARREAADLRLTQEVRVIEGHTAQIQVGTERPIVYRETFHGPLGRGVRETTEYVAADSGFLVTPRVQGNRVTLEVTAGTARLAADRAMGQALGQGMDTSSVSTQVETALGEWVSIGGSSETRDGRSAGVLRSARASRDRQATIEIRVLDADTQQSNP
jgi:type II secretory pathway component GspD/PulD (secretin)